MESTLTSVWSRRPLPPPRTADRTLVHSGGRRRFRQCHSRCTGFAAALVLLPGAAHTRGVSCRPQRWGECLGILVRPWSTVCADSEKERSCLDCRNSRWLSEGVAPRAGPKRSSLGRSPLLDSLCSPGRRGHDAPALASPAGLLVPVAWCAGVSHRDSADALGFLVPAGAVRAQNH